MKEKDNLAIQAMNKLIKIFQTRGLHTSTDLVHDIYEVVKNYQYAQKEKTDA